MNGTEGSQLAFRKIPIELIAKKFAAIENYECLASRQLIAKHPRFLELLLFIQAASMRPGGLFKFALEVFNEFPERFGTPTMRRCKGGKYTLEEKIAIRNETPCYLRSRIGVGEGAILSAEINSNVTPAELKELKASECRELAEAMSHVNPQELRNFCLEHARNNFPEYLVRLCTESISERSTREDEEAARELDDCDSEPSRPRVDELWYFDDAIGALIQFMDRHERRVVKRIAMTAVTKLILETVEEALETRIPQIIRGGSRLGKTESLEIACEMKPGCLRLVTVPPGNSLRELVMSMADSLGIDTSYGSGTESLKGKLKYIFRHTRIVPVFDEGARLIPQSYSRSTLPSRMEWVRAELFDQDIPSIIAVTPQWFDGQLDAFVSRTNYAIEQFLGRCEKVQLPSDLPDCDLVLVAALHFPEIKRNSDLLDIAACAAESENYLRAIEQISRRARYMAKRTGACINMDLVRMAARRPGGPCSSPAPSVDTGSANSSLLKAGFRSVNGPLKGVHRNNRQPKTALAYNEALQSRSLRGTGPEMGQAETVSAKT